MYNYLLESLDSLSLKKEIDNIIKKNHFQDAVKNTYDLEEVSLDNALEDLDTYGFLSEKKCIIINHLESLKQEENKNKIDHLLKYIDNPSQDNLLIITATKLNNTFKLTKELKNKCTYILVEQNNKNYIKESLKGYKIDNQTICYLEEYCQNDFSKIENEIEKLKNYKYEEKEITKNDINDIVIKKLGDSKELTFAFSKAIATKDKKEALLKYQELLSYNIEPLSIIGLLASQLRIIYQVKILEKDHLSDKEIANILEEKSDYRIKKTRELTRIFTEEELLECMQKLSDIDLKIKTTDINPNTLIEQFIINL